MSLAMFLVLPMVFLVIRQLGKKVYLTDGLTVEEYRVRKEIVNLFLAKILVISLSIIVLYVVMSIVINVAIFLAPYILVFFGIALVFAMLGGGSILGLVLRIPGGFILFL